MSDHNSAYQLQNDLISLLFASNLNNRGAKRLPKMRRRNTREKPKSEQYPLPTAGVLPGARPGLGRARIKFKGSSWFYRDLDIYSNEIVALLRKLLVFYCRNKNHPKSNWTSPKFLSRYERICRPLSAKSSKS